MDKKRLWGIAKILLKVGFTAFLIWLVSRKLDLADVKQVFLKSNPLFLLAAFLFFCTSIVISSIRLLYYVRSIGLNLGFGFNLRLYLLGMFYNMFLPGGIGGDGYKIYILRKKFQLPTKRIFLSLLLDRISGLWAVGLLSVMLIIMIPQIRISGVLAGSALVAGSVIYYLVLRRFFPDYSKKFIPVHLMAGLVQGFQLGSVVLILLSVDFQGKFSPYLFSFLVSSLATVIPISFGPVGIREYVMTHASAVFNMNEALAVFVTLAFTLLATVASLSGLWFVYRSKEFDPLPAKDEAENFEKTADEQLDVKE
jgi:glycosyltransferase 2 family protein